MAATPDEPIDPPRPDKRRRLGAALVVLGGLCLLLALPLGYLNREVFSSSGFADNSVRSLESSAVRTKLSNDVTQALVVQDPSLVSVEPVLRGLTETLVTSPPVEAIVRLAAGQTHAALFSSNQQSVVIDLANLGVAVIGFIDRQNPQAANRLQQPRSLALKLANRTLTLDLIKLANTVRLLAFLLPLLALTLFAAALATTRNRPSRGSRRYRLCKAGSGCCTYCAPTCSATGCICSSRTAAFSVTTARRSATTAFTTSECPRDTATRCPIADASTPSRTS